MDRGDWWATVHGVIKVGHDLVTNQQLLINNVVKVFRYTAAECSFSKCIVVVQSLSCVCVGGPGICIALELSCMILAELLLRKHWRTLF